MRRDFHWGQDTDNSICPLPDRCVEESASIPSVIETRLTATATVGPEPEPKGLLRRLYGFLVCPPVRAAAREVLV